MGGCRAGTGEARCFHDLPRHSSAKSGANCIEAPAEIAHGIYGEPLQIVSLIFDGYRSSPSSGSLLKQTVDLLLRRV
jgi:hypothetical protein